MNKHVTRMVFAACAVLSIASATLADTISYADAISLLAKECGQDIKKHCAGLNLGNGRIQACLQEHQSSVSPTCTSTLASVTRSIQIRQEAQASFSKVCKGDALRHCKGVVGEFNVLGCLIKTQHINTANCNQAITDAGWR